MKCIFVICAVFTLAACATTQNVWVKSGSSNADFYADRGQCTAQAFSVSNPTVMQIEIIRSSCMQGKGWHMESRPR